MFNSSVPYSVPVAPLTAGYSGNGGFFGNGDSWAWIIILALLFGWGGNGNGFGFGGGGGFQRGFDTQTIVSKLDGLTNGLCDSTFALNNTVQNGFFNNERGLWNLSSQFADCCCTTQRAIDGVNYNMAKNTCDLQNTMNTNTRDIVENANCNTRAILDFLVQSKLDEKDAQIAELKRAASQDRQNALLTTAMTQQTNAIIDRIAPYPVPAFQVAAPYPYCGYGNYGNYGNYGCGCGC